MGKRSPARVRKRAINNCRRKVPHDSYDAAELAMIETAMSGRLRYPDTAVYQCAICGQFHWASHDQA